METHGLDTRNDHTDHGDIARKPAEIHDDGLLDSGCAQTIEHPANITLQRFLRAMGHILEFRDRLLRLDEFPAGASALDLCFFRIPQRVEIVSGSRNVRGACLGRLGERPHQRDIPARMTAGTEFGHGILRFPVHRQAVENRYSQIRCRVPDQDVERGFVESIQ